MAKKSKTPAPPRPVQSPKRRVQPKNDRRRRWYLIAGGALLLVLILGLGSFLIGGDDDAREALQRAGCTREAFPSQGARHVTEVPEGFEYNSTPATSGPHEPNPLAPAVWGTYDAPVPQLKLIHNLEHGGVVVQYGPEVPTATVEQILTWYREDPNGLVVSQLPEDLLEAEPDAHRPRDPHGLDVSADLSRASTRRRFRASSTSTGGMDLRPSRSRRSHPALSRLAEPGWRNGRRRGLKILVARASVGSTPTPGTSGPDRQNAWSTARVLLIAAVLAAFLFVPSPWGLVLVVAAAALEVAETVFWIRFSRRRRIQVGAETLLGAEAVVTQPCRPLGQVRLGGELWQARCEAGAVAGLSVRVIGRDDLVLLVEPLDAGK